MTSDQRRGFIIGTYKRGTMLHEVKGKLAKLLATENLIIEHRAVETAQFDVVRRADSPYLEVQVC